MAASLLLLAALAGVLFLQAWPPAAIVRTGSMAPGTDVGDIVILKRVDPSSLRVGEVVEVAVPMKAQREMGYPPRVTHRIVAIEDGLVTVKGDALDEPDPFKVPVAQVDKRVVAVVPYAGRVVAFLTSPLGLMWLGIGAAIFFIAPLHDLRRQQPFVLSAPVPVAAGPPEEIVEIRNTVRELVSAIGEYGEHLRSHTSVVQEMSAASRHLASVTARLAEAVPAAPASPPAGTAPPPAPPPAPAPSPAPGPAPSPPTPEPVPARGSDEQPVRRRTAARKGNGPRPPAFRPAPPPAPSAGGDRDDLRQVLKKAAPAPE